MSESKTIEVIYCELCQEWVEAPMMVCEYRGRSGFVTITSEGWPDRKPVKKNIHRLAEAIKALGFYSRQSEHSHIAKEALKNIHGEEK